MTESQKIGEKQTKDAGTERKSVPPQTNSEKLRAYLGKIGVLIEKRIDEETSVARKEITDEITRKDTAYNAALGAAAAREEAAGKVISEFEEVKKEVDEYKEAVQSYEKKAGETETTVDGYNKRVEAAEKRVSELEAAIEGAKKGAEFRIREVAYDIEQKISKFMTVMEERLEDARMKIDGLIDDNERLTLAQQGINKRMNEADQKMAEVKQTAEKASTDAGHVEELIKDAEKLAQDLTKSHSEISDEFERVRTSLTPPPSAEAVAAAEAIDPAPPAEVEVPKVEEKSGKVNGNGLLGKIDENEKALQENGENIETLWQATEVLLDAKPTLGPVKEPAAVEAVDVSKYEGYNKLTPIAKDKILPALAMQIKEVREESAVLDSLYEATGRLIRSEGLDTLLPAPSKQSILLEKPVKFESLTLNQIALSTADEIARELRKQQNKIKIISGGLERVADARDKAEGE